MSTHHQLGSPHFQFKQSPHKQRVCTGAPCGTDSQFVYARREMSGWAGVGWETIPEQLTKLYRKITILFTTSHYTLEDPFGTPHWEFWKDYEFESVVEMSSDCNTVVSHTGTGSLNGLVYSITSCPEPVDYRKPFDEIEFETAPDGTTGHYDIPPDPGSYPLGSSQVIELTTASEDHIVFEYTSTDGTAGVWFKIVTDILMEEPLDPATITDLLAEMMNAVPLTRGAPIALTGAVNVDGDPVSGTFGFMTKGADFNHVTLFWDTSECCEVIGLVKIPHIANHSDVGCNCSIDYEGDLYDVRVFQDRKQTYVPASFTYTIAGSPGGGDGVLHSAGPYTGIIYGVNVFYAIPGGGGDPVLQVDPDPNVFRQSSVFAFGKKSLLARTDPDDWTVQKESTEEGFVYTCLPEPETPVTKCYRYYFPNGCDSPSAGTNVEIFEMPLATDVRIFREIPELTLDMSEDCPVPPPGEPDCPIGGDGAEDFDPNPCVEE